MPSPCKYFVSYAHADQQQAKQLLDLLQPRLKIASDMEFSDWIDHKIILGERWHEQIGNAIKDCDFGLLLLSPSFFASPYIVEKELKKFISSKGAIKKAIVPVGLKAVPFDGSADLKGVQHVQIFLDQQNRWFNTLRGPSKDAFADQLTAKILAKLRTAP